MKFYVSLWAAATLGVVVCAGGCAKPTVIEVEPILCPPFTEVELDEYDVLEDSDTLPNLRAWIREAERACRANEATVYGQ